MRASGRYLDAIRTAPRWTTEDGRLAIRLPNGTVLVYSEDELAELILEAFTDPRLLADERSADVRIETLRRLAGEVRWRHARETYALLPIP